MDKDTSEIVKLTERISKDPKSKLFVPLAEEYKKIGDIEMAIHVLSEGLKNNPAYVTARSLLGRLLYENGDLVAAQKEFEEVVKAIPDNLLAQRKLGDLYSLQNNHTEALKHYRNALALNPDDKSFAALVSKLEESLGLKTSPEQAKGPVSPMPEPAGEPERPAAPTMSKSVTAALQASSAAGGQRQPGNEEAFPLNSKLSAEEIEATGEKAAETSSRQEPASESAYKEPPLSPMPAKQGLFAETEQALESFTAPSEMEEPEEVLAVEPIEEEGYPETPFIAEKPFSTERVPENRSYVKEASNVDISIFEQKLPNDESGMFGEQESAASVTPAASEESSEDVHVTLPEPELSARLAADESDDFTTDTLAELYIAQGFYEKAIDIYERMMADHPDSLGLKEKLSRVRAMASVNPPEEYATAVMSSQDALNEKIETGIFEEPKEYASPQEITEKTEEEQAAKESEKITESAILSGEQEAHPLETELQSEPKEGVAAAPITSENKATSLFDEALEYKPEAGAEEHTQNITNVQTADIVLSSLNQEASGTTKASNSTPRQSIAARKETIDRLENWLKNIKKEK